LTKIIDSREHKLVSKLPDAQKRLLEVGDAVLEGIDDKLIFERKALPDLMNSIYDGRLWEQLKALSNTKDQGYKPYIIIEGDYIFDSGLKKMVSMATYFKRHPDREYAFYNAVFNINKFGVDFVITKDNDGTALFLQKKDEELGKTKEIKDFPLREGFRKSWDASMKREYLMDCFGHATGKALLKAWNGDITNALTQYKSKRWDTAKIQDIKIGSGKNKRRIGEAKAKEIIEVLCIG
jgi:ERCC4-type nuclease